MSDVVSKFCRAGELALDTCAVTLATAKEFLQLPVHRRLVECENDSALFRGALLSLLEVYAKRILSPDSYISRSEKVVGTQKVFVEEMAALASKRKADCWTMPPRLVPLQKFSMHVLQFLENMYKETRPFETCRHIPRSN